MNNNELLEQFERVPYLERLIINSGVFVEFGHSDLENAMNVIVNVDVELIVIHPDFHKNENNTAMI